MRVNFASAAALERLAERYDPAVFDVGRRRARLRLQEGDHAIADVIIEHPTATLVPPTDARADAILIADAETWNALAAAELSPMLAFRRGRLRIRHDLHLGIGFLAATAPEAERGKLRIRPVPTAAGAISVMEAGSGDPVLLLHGLGATKASFLPTLGALAGSYRTIALDLPGFGDSAKPLFAAYDPAFFARAVTALLDALELESAHLVGNSMGGRVAIETGLQSPGRVRRIVLLAPSLAWLRARPWAPYLRLIPTELGLIQPAPRAIVEPFVRSLIPGAHETWAAAGVDEFLRSYLTPSGRAAFYAAARNIYLEEPHGKNGFWTRLRALQPEAMFVWGRQDRVVPIAFARHVRSALPSAVHLELNCGHVPQLERPRETHRAMERFLQTGRP